MSPPSSSSTSAQPERPAFPPLTRQHSRSSSQLATFAALALSPVSTSNPPLPRPGTPPRGGRQSLGGSPRFGTFTSLSSSPRGASSRRGSISSDSDESSSSGGGQEGAGTPREREHDRTDSGSTAATSGASDNSASNRTPQVLKDRRSTFPSISSPLHLPTLTSTSPSPAASPSASPATPGAAFHRSNSASTSPLASPSFPPTDPTASTSAALSSFPATSTSLAQFIQHKRRQASAPYFASARERSLFSPGAGFSLGPGPTNAGQGEGGYFGGWGSGVGGDAAAGGVAGGASRRTSLDRDMGAGAASLPPSRSRSRASSRRGTTSGLLLQTGGLMLGVPGGETADPSAGLVVTPTTEEWRQLGEELVDLQEKREKERERKRTGGVAEGKVSPLNPARDVAERGEEGEKEEKAKSPVMPRWKRWASLRDSDDEEDDEDASSEDEEGDEFALSLSLSRFSKYKQNHQLPHTPPPFPSPSVHAPGSASAPAATPAATEEPTRPSIPKTYKSSFSYSSSGGGMNGGFTSHSNTSSISSFHAPLSNSSSAGSSAWNLSLSLDPSNDLATPPSLAAARRGSAPDSDPLPHVETFASTSSPLASPSSSFAPGHAVRRSESAIAVPSYLQPQPHRPALSRGSLSSATGGLSTPSPPASVTEASSTPMSVSGSSDRTTVGRAEGLHEREVDRAEKEVEREKEKEKKGGEGEETPSPARSRRPSVPRIPLPPNVFRSLDQGEGSAPSSFASTPLDGATDGKGSPTVAVTPLSVAATPYDGDPFSSLAPASVSQFIPPTPSIAPDTPSVPAARPVDLDWTKPLGPVDPRTYSAVTGLRDISSFVVEGDEAGKGAYGSVRRAREKGPDGKAVGPPLIIKYVIKQRILADCWKKHKVLGPIPIEVHVLDHLRRVPYEPRPAFHYLSSSSRAVNGSGRRPKGAAPVRRDSAPKLDLWTGGEGGGAVRTGHPNVCGLLDFFEDNEFYMLVMPQATASPSSCSPLSTSSSDFQPPKHGQDLFDHVDASPTGLPPNEIRHILRQLTDALWFLHEHSIVHRDIKDENVVLDGDGTVRLIDFGSAAYVKEGRKFDTFSGTLDFAAPEVLKGARYGGKEQDVWALGVLGYVLVCGECPFWSPDEAMQGLNPSTRALSALQSKLASSPSSPPTTTATSSPPAPASAAAAYAAVEAALDASSPPLMADAVDLVQRCLEIDPLNRPTADMICDHVFLAGKGGWRGYRGWEKADEDEDGDEGEEADGEKEE